MGQITKSGESIAGELIVRESSVAADTDEGVVATYLREVEAIRSPNTLRLYRREVTNFVGFFKENDLKLRDLKREHMTGYMVMLQKKRPPLKQASIETIAGAVSGFMSYLAKVGYIGVNPGAALSFRKEVSQDDHVDKFFNERQWESLLETAGLIRSTVKRERLKFILIAGEALCLRVGDLAALKDNDFFVKSGAWWVHVLGKGNKRASLPVPPRVLEALNAYRDAQKLPAFALPAENDGTIQSLYHREPLGVTGISREIKALYKATSTRLYASDQGEDAAWIAEATPHWLRHTGITRLIAADVPPEMVKKMARHERFRTTERYIHTDRDEWHASITAAVVRPDKRGPE